MTGETAASGKRYKAFISYSHAADHELARTLQRALQRFGRPRFRRPLISVFRDETGLAASPAMWPEIARTLDASEFLILLASPPAARSPWVQREVEYWLKNRSASTLLLAVTHGEIAWDIPAGDFEWAATDNLPRALKGVFVEMPLWVDLRWTHAIRRLTLRNRRLQSDVATLLATLRGLDKGDVLNEELIQQRWIVRLMGGALGLISVLLIAAVTLGVFAAAQRDEAERQRNEARRETRIAVSREYASASVSSLNVDPERSILLGLEAVKVEATLAAEDALRRALVASHVRAVVRFGGSTIERQEGIGASPAAVAFSPDGRYLLSGGNDGTIRLLEVRSQAEPSILGSAAGQITMVAFDPSGMHAVTASRDGTAIVWDIPTRSPIAVLHGHEAAVGSAAFSPDGTRIVTAADDGTAREWDGATGRQLVALVGHQGQVVSATFSPDGKKILTTGSDSTVRVWDASSARPVFDPIALDFQARSAAFSPDGRYIVTAGGLDADLWSASSGAFVRKFHSLVVGGSVNRATFSNNGHWVLTASAVGTVVWDVASGGQVKAFQNDSGLGDWDAAFNPSDDEVVTAGEDGVARVWDLIGGGVVATFRGHLARVTTSVFSPDGEYVATGSPDSTARLWRVMGSEVIDIDGWADAPPEFMPAGPALWAVADDEGRVVVRNRATQGVTATWPVPRPGTLRATTNSASMVALTWDDGSATICEIRTGRPLTNLRVAASSAAQPTFSPDGNWLAVPTSIRTADGSAVEEVTITDTSTWRVAAELVGPSLPVTGIEFNPDSSIVGGIFGDSATLWSVSTWDTVVVLRGDGATMTALTFSPDGERVVTTSVDGTATVWDAATGSEVMTLRGHEATVWTAMYSPDGAHIATASDDGTVRLWDSASGEVRGTLPGSSGRYMDAMFSANGQWVVATTSVGQLSVFTVSVDELIRIANARLTRQLTCSERSAYLHEDLSCGGSPKPTASGGSSG